MSRVLVTGAEGLLGSRITTLFRNGGRTVVGLGSRELDITDATALDDAIAPRDVVINCAAYTAVDAAETDRDRAFAVNASGAGLVARFCAAKRARLVHLSTGYVFDGTSPTPYETSSSPRPINVYGESKLEGERAVRDELPDALVVRTMWLHAGPTTAFPAALLRRCSQGNPVSVVTDQVSSPTSVDDLVDALVALIAHPDPPLLTHATSTGTATKYDFARLIATTAGLDTAQLRPCLTTDVHTAADRPRTVVLSDSSWTARGLKPLPHWRDAYRRAT
ncbi:dTDP-4-dehydrorhamnose reductase [Umezawaea sp. NPDC059074]|uniref:dTDP-4-dehydrorhamnose reductase n=1 Tax=Umezawaea sp. NPDC059074 TaxID=3346716 RepID=UPI0036AEE8F1